MIPAHPGCSCYHCQVARETKRLQEALQTAQAQSQARAREVKELREHLHNVQEQVALLNQQVVGLVRDGNAKGEDPAGA